MKQRSSFTILCFVLISFGVVSVSAQTCIQNRRSFTPNDTYDANRHRILSSLPSDTAARGGFYNGSVGEEPNRVYAVGMCIPGSSPGDCSDCVKSASDWLKQDCLNQTDAYYWTLDPTLCLVRYSSTSFLGSASYWEIVPQYLVLNTANITTNLTEFTTVWEDLTVRMIAAASVARSTSSSNSNHYTANVAALTKFQNIYALMQCTPDISPGDCENCLRQSVMDYQSCCRHNTGGYVMRQICFFRWQLFTFSKAFGNITFAPPPTPSPPPMRRPVTVSQPPSRAKRTDNSSGKFSVGTIVAIVLLGLVIVIASSVLLAWGRGLLCWRRESYQEVELKQTGITTVCIRKYTFETIETATDNFSERRKIGEGGFGIVYKGLLPKGREVAVKRLLKTSKQSEKDFKNEVFVVAKLQHHNLVRILGFSVKGEERILVYEFVPKKSLNYFLFDPTRQGELDWTRRYKIIEGIGSGILYLHKDSGLKVIHRDLKVDNILLEDDMNPKIADFGMAKIFGMDKSTANTSRIAGTEGYMPPEYYNEGHVSTKFDVYSFGVLVLEIICGKRNRSFNSPGQNFVLYAWRLWRDGSPLDLVDTTIGSTYPSEEVTRCINIALLCVQNDHTDRPDMSIIMPMLTNNTIVLPDPKPPGFCNIPDPTLYHSAVRSNSQIINDGT